MQRFNLIDEPWIPCIWLDGNGRPEPLSLRDVLVYAHRIREVYTDSPLAVAALHRLLLAIVHRLFGPEDRWAWADLWRDGQGQWNVQRLDEYFARWHSRFYLLDELHPFYQAVKFPEGVQPDPNPISQLAYERAAGNNTVLFDHHVDTTPELISPAEAARRLVTAQAFTIGFGKSYKQNSKWVSFQDGPCARGALFLVKGDNLFQTLLLSMREYPDPGSRLPDDMDEDRPAWEMDDPFAPGREVPFGYLDYLTWQSLRAQLISVVTDEGIRVSHVRRIQGLRLSKKEVFDPLKSYREDLSVRGFTGAKSLWRDSAALFELTVSPQHLNLPENFQLLAALVNRAKILQREQRFRYAAFGLATEKGQARNVAFWRYERMPLLLEYLANEDAVASLRDALRLAETVSWRLEDARDWLAWLWLTSEETRTLFKWKESREYKRRRQNSSFMALQNKLPIAAHYWWRLEKPFKTVMEGLAGPKFEDARLQWRATLRRVAWAAFREMSVKLAPTPRSLRAIAKAESELKFGLNVALKVNEGRQNE